MVRIITQGIAMNWLMTLLTKEAAGRRWKPGDKVRFFTAPRKGKGSVVLTPYFQKGRVRDFDSKNKKYKVETTDDDNNVVEEHDVHPRNLVASRIRIQTRGRLSKDT